MQQPLGDLSAPDFRLAYGAGSLDPVDQLWLHAGADAAVALACWSVPVALGIFLARRGGDLALTALLLALGAFALACGAAYAGAAWTLWRPGHPSAAALELAGGLLALLGAAAAWRALPAALARPGPDALEAANRALAREVAARSQAEAAERRAVRELGDRVAERTADLAAANERLRAALAEKEALLREVHHRVKNNLQVVSGLLTLQARNAGVPGLAEQYQDSLERIHAMGRVHEQLYLSGDASSFDLAAYVEGLAADLARIHGARGRRGGRGVPRVAALVEAEAPVRVPLDAATPLALILSEVLSNAYKHAFPDGRAGRVAVSLGRADGGTRLVVRDDGVGLPEDGGGHRSADRAAGGRGGRSPMGLRLVELLARQVGAATRLERDGGTRFTLVLPDGPGEQASAA